MPCVCYYLEEDDLYEIVDGYHRYLVMKQSQRIYDREKGMLPVTVIEKDISNRMASTIRHNRARGMHNLELMTEIDYAEAHHVPLKITRETNYSKDKNLWHLSHEGLDLEDPANEPDYAKPGFLELGVAPEQAPDTPAYITIHFEKGKPTALDGKAMKASTLLKELNAVGGANGIGIIDIVENRLVGMKSRGVYETPGGTILYFAHEQLEMLCLDKETAHYKALVAQKFADIVYNGQWYTPLREALSAFVDKTQENVTGDVKLKLYKGNIIPAGTTSPYSLYSEDLATFGEDSVYDQADSAGFIHLFGLPITVQAKLKEKLAAEKE